MNKRSLGIGSYLLAIAISYPIFGVCQQTTSPLQEARSLLNSGKLSESEAVLRTYLDSSQANAEAHFLLGYVYFRDKKAKESLAEYTAGAKLKRPRASDFKVIASDYVLLDAFEDADKWFSEVVSETPEDADAWYLLGRTKYNENDMAGAVKSFERALTLRPKYVEAENNLGLSWKEQNEQEKAQAAFQNAIDWQGDAQVDAQPFLNLGTLLADQGDWTKAIPYLAKADALSPHNPTIHEKLGDVYSAQQNLPKAQSEFEQAIASAPNTSALHFKLGQILRKEGLRDRAEKEFQICAKLNSGHSSGKTPNAPATDHSEPH